MSHPLGDSDIGTHIQSRHTGSRCGTQGICPLWKHHFMDSVPELLNSRGLMQPVQESLSCAVDPLGGEELGSAMLLSSLQCCSQFPDKFIKEQHKDFGDHNQVCLELQGWIWERSKQTSRSSISISGQWCSLFLGIHPSDTEIKAAGEGRGSASCPLLLLSELLKSCSILPHLSFSHFLRRTGMFIQRSSLGGNSAGPG